MDNKRKDVLQLWCKNCGKLAKQRQYRHGRKEAVTLLARKYVLKRNYNLTLENYDNMLKEQNGVCAICGKKETNRSNPKGKIDSLRVDHCHKTGRVRGLLCSECNFGISKFKDDIELIKKAIQYLKKHGRAKDN